MRCGWGQTKAIVDWARTIEEWEGLAYSPHNRLFHPLSPTPSQQRSSFTRGQLDSKGRLNGNEMRQTKRSDKRMLQITMHRESMACSTLVFRNPLVFPRPPPHFFPPTCYSKKKFLPIRHAHYAFQVANSAEPLQAPQDNAPHPGTNPPPSSPPKSMFKPRAPCRSLGRDPPHTTTAFYY